METIDYHFAQGVGTITLNRPQSRNALNVRMGQELGDLLVAVRADREVRALIITGAGGAFSSGGDMRESSTRAPRTHEQRRDHMDLYARIVREALGLDRPIIAAVDGVAYGAGFSLALLADIIVVSERARFCMAFQRMGLAPDVGALYTLPRVVGLQRARELFFSAREVDAQEAVRIGLAMEVVAPQDLMPRVQAIAHSFTGASAVAMSVTKRALQASLNSDLPTMLELEASGQAIASGADYLKEAAQRFVNKQPLQFQWPAAKPSSNSPSKSSSDSS